MTSPRSGGQSSRRATCTESACHSAWTHAKTCPCNYLAKHKARLELLARQEMVCLARDMTYCYASNFIWPLTRSFFLQEIIEVNSSTVWLFGPISNLQMYCFFVLNKHTSNQKCPCQAFASLLTVDIFWCYLRFDCLANFAHFEVRWVKSHVDDFFIF